MVGFNPRPLGGAARSEGELRKLGKRLKQAGRVHLIAHRQSGVRADIPSVFHIEVPKVIFRL